ncbi:uncharacterized protein LOC143300063 [Babylonia areolata]|uniref:uncharacterized protein LOC143300063 n=1 Tax=Babylonia areolata TaxID=304850 RepID=UPI003FD4172E
MVSIKVLVLGVVLTSVLDLPMLGAAIYQHHRPAYPSYGTRHRVHATSYGRAVTSHGYGRTSHGYGRTSHGYGYRKPTTFLRTGVRRISETDYLLKKLKDLGAQVVHNHHHKAKAFHQASSSLGKSLALLSVVGNLGKQIAGHGLDAAPHGLGYGDHGSYHLPHGYQSQKLGYGARTGAFPPQYTRQTGLANAFHAQYAF